MPEAIAQKLFETCGIAYMEGYGMTETISQTHSNPANHPKKQCLGIPVFDTESLVVDPETLRVLEAGDAGEIVVRGPHVITSYSIHYTKLYDRGCHRRGPHRAQR